MAKKEGGEVVPGVFGGKHTIEHLIKHLREDANPRGPVILMYEEKNSGDIIPVLFNISTEDVCFFAKTLDITINRILEGEPWSEDEEE